MGLFWMVSLAVWSPVGFKTLCRGVVPLGWGIGAGVAGLFLLGATAAPGLAQGGDWANADALYGFFAQSCQQQASHSLWLWDHPMALCARCVGVYLAVALGAAWKAIRGFWISFAEPRLGKPEGSLVGSSGSLGLPLVLLCLALMDKVLTWTVGWEPPVWVRLVAGLLLGLSLGALGLRLLSKLPQLFGMFLGGDERKPRVLCLQTERNGSI